MLPQLMVASSDIQSITLQSERYWPVTIHRANRCDGASGKSGRWMHTLESSRKLHVKRRNGHLPYRLDHFATRGVVHSWFPTFMKPQQCHIELLLQVPKMCAGTARPLVSEFTSRGGLMIPWLQHAGIVTGHGPQGLGSLMVSSVEWAAALCCKPLPPLPPNVYEFDFSDGDEGSLSERFAAMLLAAEPSDKESNLSSPPRVSLSHWLHECVIESKLVAFPLYLLLHLQMCTTRQHCGPAPVYYGPASLACSAITIDQLLTIEEFYQSTHENIGAQHSPLISKDFITSCCATVRKSFSKHGGEIDKRVTLAAITARFNGLPGHGGSGGRDAISSLLRLRHRRRAATPLSSSP